MKVLSGGAAAAVVKDVQDQFRQLTGHTVEGSFSAVGAMRDRLLAGAPCDLVILTRAIVAQLVASGHLRAGTERSLGTVRTGVAVKAGQAHPAIGTREALAATLRQARGIYFPDPENATAGIHFMRVLKTLGLDASHAAALRTYPNGATAMAAMAQCDEPGLIGCTQVTEINYTPGVELVGALPAEFELATDYTLGISSACTAPEQARILAELLTGPASEAIRRQGGFEF